MSISIVHISLSSNYLSNAAIQLYLSEFECSFRFTDHWFLFTEKFDKPYHLFKFDLSLLFQLNCSFSHNMDLKEMDCQEFGFCFEWLKIHIFHLIGERKGSITCFENIQRNILLPFQIRNCRNRSKKITNLPDQNVH